MARSREEYFYLSGNRISFRYGKFSYDKAKQRFNYNGFYAVEFNGICPKIFIGSRNASCARMGTIREWNDFPPEAENNPLIIHFDVKDSSGPGTISLRQYDISREWEVLLNGKSLGYLMLDEKDMISYFEIPTGSLKLRDNLLEVRSRPFKDKEDQISDDIFIGQVFLDKRPLNQILAESLVEVEITEAKTNRLLPSRITIVDKNGSLQPTAISDDESLTMRSGVIYTGTGKASFRLPAGAYTIYASRGFEYGCDSARITLKPGSHIYKELSIRREVLAPGWISCDPHIHSLTYSGHGDATIRERILTIAGEGLYLPIMTDHNTAVNITAESQRMSMGSWFTPVIGDELTTSVGHFNIFPVMTGVEIPDYHVQNWDEVSRNIGNCKGVKVVTLNHARDIHNGFRPFDPKIHIAVAGRSLNGWTFPANAMEVMNSGSQQPDPTQLYFDWMGMLNRGFFLSPVGSSDSHEVSRYLVGQARTYIRYSKKDSFPIDIHEVMENFSAGKVSVSFGLLTDIIVDSFYGPGDMITTADSMQVSVKVMAPGWMQADHITLYENGIKIRESTIPKNAAGGIKWQGKWKMPKPEHDVILVAVARGPGTHVPFWPIARPFEHKSSQFNPQVLGISGAVRIDANGDHHFTSAYEYAKELWESSNHEIPVFINKLKNYDESVSIQAASVMEERGVEMSGNDLTKALSKAPLKVRNGFGQFIKYWKMSKAAR